MAYCTNCGKETAGKKVCEHCGAKRNKKHIFCEWCGTEFVPRKRLCPNCGEPRRIALGIGNVFRIFFAVCFLIAGITNIASVPLPAIFFLLFGILLLPYSKKVFRKLTHHNLKLRKILSFIISPALLIMAFVCTDACLKVNGYNDAVEDWNNEAYSVAMNYFSRYPNYKDNDQYIDRFEREVLESLMRTSWGSDMVMCGDIIDDHEYARCNFAFNSDGTVLRRDQIWKYTGYGYAMDSYTDIVQPFSFVYDNTTYVQIGSDSKDARKYMLYLSTADDGKIEVVGIVGDIYVPDYQKNHFSTADSDWVEQPFIRNASLPE